MIPWLKFMNADDETIESFSKFEKHKELNDILNFVCWRIIPKNKAAGVKSFILSQDSPSALKVKQAEEKKQERIYAVQQRRRILLAKIQQMEEAVQDLLKLQAQVNHRSMYKELMIEQLQNKIDDLTNRVERINLMLIKMQNIQVDLSDTMNEVQLQLDIKQTTEVNEPRKKFHQLLRKELDRMEEGNSFCCIPPLLQSKLLALDATKLLTMRPSPLPKFPELKNSLNEEVEKIVQFILSNQKRVELERNQLTKPVKDSPKAVLQCYQQQAVIYEKKLEMEMEQQSNLSSDLKTLNENLLFQLNVTKSYKKVNAKMLEQLKKQFQKNVDAAESLKHLPKEISSIYEAGIIHSVGSNIALAPLADRRNIDLLASIAQLFDVPLHSDIVQRVQEMQQSIDQMESMSKELHNINENFAKSERIREEVSSFMTNLRMEYNELADKLEQLYEHCKSAPIKQSIEQTRNEVYGLN